MKITNKAFLTLIFGLILGVISPLQAVIVEAEQGKLGDKVITLLSDVHLQDYKDPINYQQKLDFTQFITKNQNNLLVIVEDMADTSSIDEHIDDELKNKLSAFIFTEKNRSTSMFLLGITEICKNQDIDVYNSEFRQLEASSESKDSTIYLDAIKNLMNKIMDEIKDYKTDNNIVKSVYDSIINETSKRMNSIYTNELLADSQNINFATLKKRMNQRYNKEEILQTYEALTTYNSALIDARIVNQILTTSKKHILVCAGAGHIKFIKQILALIQYTTEYHRRAYIPSFNQPFYKLPLRILNWLGYHEFIIDNDYYLHKPLNLKQFFSKPRMPSWLKIGLGAMGVAAAYTLYKRFNQ